MEEQLQRNGIHVIPHTARVFLVAGMHSIQDLNMFDQDYYKIIDAINVVVQEEASKQDGNAELGTKEWQSTMMIQCATIINYVKEESIIPDFSADTTYDYHPEQFRTSPTFCNIM